MDDVHGADPHVPTSATGWARLPVSHCQYQVFTVPGASGLGIYVLGDDLLHVSGLSRVTGFCGVNTGWIEARVRVLPGPQTQTDVGWDAISEATLWSPSGRLAVVGLMGGSAEALTDVAVPRGLIRVRVHARDRIHEAVRTDRDPPERHELHIWAVSEETSWRTVLAGAGACGWEQKPAKAAEWAMLSLVSRPSGRPAFLPPPSPDPYEDDAGLSRVAVVRLDRIDAGTLLWSWATAAEPIFPVPLTTLPDDEPGVVRLTSGPDGFTLRHEGVLGRHAFALGLIWDHLLDTVGSYPWLRTLRGQAAEATASAERNRRRQAERDAERWGGVPPSDRIRRIFD